MTAPVAVTEQQVVDTIRRALAEAFVEANNAKERSQQTAVGMSQIGSCQRQVAWQHAGVAVDAGYADVGRAAMLGTWLHEGLLPPLGTVLGRVLGAEPYVEQGVDLEGLPGHLDLGVGTVVLDVKTKGNMSRVRIDADATGQQWWQVELYAEARRRAGHLVTHVAVVFVDRAFGADEVFVRPSDPRTAEAALDWWRTARDADRDPDGVPLVDRGQHRGPGFDKVCDHCPYARRCWAGWETTPQELLLADGTASIEAAAELYLDAAEQEKRAKTDKAFAQAVLAGTPPKTYGRFRIGRKRTGRRLDQRAARALLEEAGLEVPLGEDGLTTTISLAPTPPPAEDPA